MKEGESRCADMDFLKSVLSIFDKFAPEVSHVNAPEREMLEQIRRDAQRGIETIQSDPLYQTTAFDNPTPSGSLVSDMIYNLHAETSYPAEMMDELLIVSTLRDCVVGFF